MQFVPPTIAASAAPRVNLVNCSEFGARDVVLIFDPIGQGERLQGAAQLVQRAVQGTAVARGDHGSTSL